MIKEKELPHLTFFNHFPREYLFKSGVASAIQNVETTLRMIPLERWPHALSLLWQSCELLLRVNLGIDLKDQTVTASQMQKKFNKDKMLSSGLDDASHNFRRLRNDILHQGYSPRDDEKCIKIYFEVGFAYCNKLVKELIGKDLFEVGREEKSNHWFWDLIEDTRKVINKKSNGSLPLYPALQPLIIAMQNINRTYGIANENISPADNNESLWEDLFQDESFDIREKLGKEIEKELKNFGNQEAIFLPKFKCFGRCNSAFESIIALIDFKTFGPRDDLCYDFFQVVAIGCVNCQFVISDPDTLSVFVTDHLSENQKKLVIRPDYVTAYDTAYQGVIIDDSKNPNVYALYNDI